MPVICWGALGKAANDPTTIDEEISAYILRHNSDPNAHGLDGYAINVHRGDNPIDHPDYSITSDKITANQIIGKDFRTAADVGDSVDGVLMNSSGMQMYQEGKQKVNIPVSGDPFFTGVLTVQRLHFLNNYFATFFESLDFMDSQAMNLTGGSQSGIGLRGFSPFGGSGLFGYAFLSELSSVMANSPFFDYRLRWDHATTGVAYFGLGSLVGRDDCDTAAGFAIFGDSLYAAARRGTNLEVYPLMYPITNTTNTFRVEVQSSARVFSYFVNGFFQFRTNVEIGDEQLGPAFEAGATVGVGGNNTLISRFLDLGYGDYEL